MDALLYIFLNLALDNVIEAFRDFAIFAFIAYIIAHSLIGHSANEDKKDVDRLQLEANERTIARAKAQSQRIDMRHNAFASSASTATQIGHSGDNSSSLTDEQRTLGKKLVAEAMKAGSH
jgi:hypothetical protein